VNIIFLRVILIDNVYFQRVLLYRNTDYVTEVPELRFAVLRTSDMLISNMTMNVLIFGSGRR
jgi:hypothetical protein